MGTEQIFSSFYYTIVINTVSSIRFILNLI